MDSGGSLDLDSNPGILWTNFTTAILAVVKAPCRGFGNSLRIRWLADLRS